MRIATRLWIALLGAIVLVLVAGVMIRIDQERRLLLDVTVRDRLFFAHALHAALSREHGNVDPLRQAETMLVREEVAASHIVARLVSTDDADSRPQPRLSMPEVTRLRNGEVIVTVLGEEILTYVPLERDGALALELAEPEAVSALLARIGWWSVAGQTFALASFAGVVTFALIGWLVGRPLARLAGFARRIAAGDLDARVDLHGGEVGLLAHEMNQMAEGLQATRAALEESNAERVAALEQLRHADRLRTVGQLASALAHELGTPLNVVSGHARMIEQTKDIGADAFSSARTILEQAGRMTRILRDLLDFARRKGESPAVHSLAELASHAAETLAPIARRYAVPIDVSKGEMPVLVRANAQHFLQVLTNLFTNAMQASPSGDRVSVHVDAIFATPPTGIHAKAGEYARVSVVDRGSGIDPEDIPHLFEPFFTRKERGEGTGLGLAVVDGIVREHGGWVSVTSEVGKGSCFEVYVPLVQKEDGAV
jgi:signal transduction histidine kinase